MTNKSRVTVRGRTQKAGLALFISEIDEEVAWHCRRKLVGLNVKRKEAGWLMVVTAVRQDKRQVAFIGAESVIECYRALYHMMHQGKLQWKDSKY